MSEPIIAKWQDRWGEEHVLLEGKGEDILYAIPERKDEEGNSHVEMLSKKALLEFVGKLNETK
ncbi:MULTISPECIES: hypothetical protein [Pontibacillus]|uniref:Uncharacterized protein n=1 Tax=Pontibacillus chungwhensis TaxID=265426 RepID=A0ABY8UYH3_9BACI|nr:MULTISPECIES: hypothetical protein [Pontibacillus]MCD5324755.1 hypothetical protein [Pontibacillus sp. HN14]WIF98715.1 hypothetical protein QNI29_03425 [Pontibacillus chungwhensis]